jgi:hypothetical protein
MTSTKNKIFAAIARSEARKIREMAAADAGRLFVSCGAANVGDGGAASGVTRDSLAGWLAGCWEWEDDGPITPRELDIALDAARVAAGNSRA